jgi:hypothetical protein
VEELEQALATKGAKVPADYQLFQFCRIFNKFSWEVREGMAKSEYDRWCGYIVAEGKADDLRRQREKLEALSRAAAQ